MLDKLAGVMQRDSAVKQRDFQATIMRPLLLRMDSTEIAWLCNIVLKSEMKIGMKEKGLLDDLHVDANNVFDTCCDLRKTFEVVAPCYPSERVKRQDTVPGQMIRPQTSNRILSINKLQSLLRTKDYIAELKLDGERIQLHRDGDKVYYWSRQRIDHGPRGYNVFDDVVKKQMKSSTCILDGELVIWHTGLKQFVQFGHNRTVMNSVRDAWIAKRGAAVGEHDDSEDEHATCRPSGPADDDELSQLQVWYMAFDILYDGDHSVIDRPLRERQEILRRAIAPPPNGQSAIEMTPPGAVVPVFGAIKPLLPGTPWSQPVRPNDPKQLQQLMQDAVDKGEEGVVFKDLDSQWQKGDRSNAWIKFKPDYLPTEDLDLLIIGAFNGTGKRGGNLSMFLMAVAEKPLGGGEPCVFHSFCRVGTGLSMENLEYLRNRLEKHLVPGGKGKHPPCYKVTGSVIETPDFWVKDPRQSVVLTVKGDMRTITTTTFYSQNTLRFPRITSVAKEKRWADICTHVQLSDQLWSSGRLSAGTKNGDDYGDGRGRSRQERRAAPRRGVRTVAPGLAAPSTEHVERVSTLFAGELILVMQPCDRDAICSLITAHGGKYVLTWVRDVTRVVTEKFSPGLTTKADEAAGVRRYPHQENVNALMDVLHVSWLHDCVARGVLLPPAPRHRLRFVAKSDANVALHLDRYGDR